jgi:hypothetical protein
MEQPGGALGASNAEAASKAVPSITGPRSTCGRPDRVEACCRNGVTARAGGNTPSPKQNTGSPRRKANQAVSVWSSQRLRAQADCTRLVVRTTRARGPTGLLQRLAQDQAAGGPLVR